jgi:purine-binding chemotaxis protein CheW
MNERELPHEKRLDLLLFTLETQRYALHLSAVERVVRAVEVTPLPRAPAIVLGVVNAQGRIIPVVNVRKRFGLPEREIDLGDSLILARTSARSVALAVDAVAGLLERSEQQVVASAKILAGVTYLDGVAKLEDGLILIHNLDSFLALEEERALDAALTTTAVKGPA